MCADWLNEQNSIRAAQWLFAESAEIRGRNIPDELHPVNMLCGLDNFFSADIHFCMLLSKMERWLKVVRNIVHSIFLHINSTAKTAINTNLWDIFIYFIAPTAAHTQLYGPMSLTHLTLFAHVFADISWHDLLEYESACNNVYKSWSSIHCNK